MTIAAVKFERDVSVVPFGSGTIRIENLTPILSAKEREQRRCEVEVCLFDVFRKYANKSGK